MNQETLFKYVEAASESTKRARVVILVMLVATVVAFSATWNSLGSGWLNSRLKASRGVERWWTELQTNTTPTFTSTADSAWFEQSKHFASLKYAPYSDGAKQALDKDLELLREHRTSDVLLINLPFFGVTFDVNDIGLIGGLSFAIILMWLAFCLASELRNTDMVFTLASDAKMLPYAYDLLLMQQVLTVAPRPGRPGAHLWTRFVVKVLYVLPLLVQTFIVWNDIDSIDFGRSVNREAMTRGLVLSSVLLATIVALTLYCVIKSWELDKDWAKWLALRLQAPPTGAA